jgi:hypothetical protein
MGKISLSEKIDSVAGAKVALSLASSKRLFLRIESVVTSYEHVVVYATMFNDDLESSVLIVKILFRIFFPLFLFNSFSLAY